MKVTILTQECLELGKMLGGLIKARRRLILSLLLMVTGFVLGILLSEMV